MDQAADSVIAQLLYSARPTIRFAAVVDDLNRVLLRCEAQRRVLHWDCDDIAMIDIDGARLLLGYGDCPSPDHATCLTVSVGPAPGDPPRSPILQRTGSFCRTIVDSIETGWPADLVLWQRIDGAMTPERRDDLLERLADLSPCAATVSRAAAVSRLRAALSSVGRPPMASAAFP